jgi:hypothetical protein
MGVTQIESPRRGLTKSLVGRAIRKLRGAIVMPNHIHGIIILDRGRPLWLPCYRATTGGVAPTLSLPDVVHRFKSMTTKRYTDGVKQSGWPPYPGKLCQRNHYEHIINNPLNWQSDEHYSE